MFRATTGPSGCQIAQALHLLTSLRLASRGSTREWTGASRQCEQGLQAAAARAASVDGAQGSVCSAVAAVRAVVQMPPRKKKDDPMAAVDALPLVQELEKALACLDAVEKDVDEGKRPGKDMDAFFQQLGRVDDAAAALPEMPIPQGALDDGADLDVVARQDLQRQLDDLAAEGHRKKNMKTLADLVEAGLDNT